MTDDIYSLDGFDENTEIAIIGEGFTSPVENDPLDYLDRYTGITDRLFLTSDEHYIKFINNILQLDMNLAEEEKINDILLTDEFEEMPEFPYEGSVRIIDGIAVVKVYNP